MDAGYLTDVLENLDLLDQSLLRYEAVLAEGTDAFSLVHIIFRYTHNAKGGLAVLEQQHLVSVVHVLENAFDRLRNRTLNPSAELLDVSFRTVGFVREMLTKGASAVDPAELIHILEGIVGVSPNSAEAANTEASLNVNQISETANAAASNTASATAALSPADDEYTYQVEKLISGKLTQTELQQLPIFSTLNEIGRIAKSNPPAASFPTNEDPCVIQITFYSKLTPDDLSMHIFDPVAVVTTPVAAPIAANAPSSGAATTTEGPKPRILIVEDELVSRLLLSRTFAKVGSCDSVSDGNEGVMAYLMAIEEGSPYNIIALDLRMQGLQGRSVLKFIRKTEIERGRFGSEQTKIIVITGSHEKDDILGCFREGADGYLTKPINRKKLDELLHKFGLEPSAEAE